MGDDAFPLRPSHLDDVMRVANHENKEAFLDRIRELQTHLPPEERKATTIAQLEKQWRVGCAIELASSSNLERVYDGQNVSTWEMVNNAHRRIQVVRPCPELHFGHCCVDGASYHASVGNVADFLRRFNRRQSRACRYTSLFRFVSPVSSVLIFMVEVGGVPKSDDNVESLVPCELTRYKYHSLQRSAGRFEDLLAPAYPAFTGADHEIYPLDAQLLGTTIPFADVIFDVPIQLMATELAVMLAKFGLGDADAWGCDRMVVSHEGKGAIKIRGVAESFANMKHVSQARRKADEAKDADGQFAMRSEKGFLKSMGCKIDEKIGKVQKPTIAKLHSAPIESASSDSVGTDDSQGETDAENKLNKELKKESRKEDDGCSSGSSTNSDEGSNGNGGDAPGKGTPWFLGHVLNRPRIRITGKQPGPMATPDGVHGRGHGRGGAVHGRGLGRGRVGAGQGRGRGGGLGGDEKWWIPGAYVGYIKYQKAEENLNAMCCRHANPGHTCRVNRRKHKHPVGFLIAFLTKGHEQGCDGENHTDLIPEIMADRAYRQEYRDFAWKCPEVRELLRLEGDIKVEPEHL